MNTTALAPYWFTEKYLGPRQHDHVRYSRRRRPRPGGIINQSLLREELSRMHSERHVNADDAPLARGGRGRGSNIATHTPRNHVRHHLMRLMSACVECSKRRQQVVSKHTFDHPLVWKF